jgi:hypothetical protein
MGTPLRRRRWRCPPSSAARPPAGLGRTQQTRHGRGIGGTTRSAEKNQSTAAHAERRVRVASLRPGGRGGAGPRRRRRRGCCGRSRCHGTSPARRPTPADDDENDDDKHGGGNHQDNSCRMTVATIIAASKLLRLKGGSDDNNGNGGGGGWVSCVGSARLRHTRTREDPGPSWMKIDACDTGSRPREVLQIAHTCAREALARPLGPDARVTSRDRPLCAMKSCRTRETPQECARHRTRAAMGLEL